MVVRLGVDQYVRWSNTTDSPVSYVMDRAEVLGRLQSEDKMPYEQAQNLLDTLVDVTGVSDDTTDAATVLGRNRAGPNEETLTVGEIVDRYRGPSRHLPVVFDGPE